MRHIEQLIADGAEFMLRALAPFDCAGSNALAMLVRRDGETRPSLLAQ